MGTAPCLLVNDGFGFALLSWLFGWKTGGLGQWGVVEQDQKGHPQDPRLPISVKPPEARAGVVCSPSWLYFPMMQPWITTQDHEKMAKVPAMALCVTEKMKAEWNIPATGKWMGSLGQAWAEPRVLVDPSFHCCVLRSVRARGDLQVSLKT